ncbi:MAG: hypothetical protein IJ268_07745 [Proteobacteria bacterium]|nr:hypothetical protein [Pseudomonadota bacterium]MBQ9243028.1 hypothetical protein [Pseudomonadota bacterium]
MPRLFKFKHPASKAALLSLAFIGCAAYSPESENGLRACEYNGTTKWCPLDTLCCLGECVKQTDENCGACGHACREAEHCGPFQNDMACLCQNGTPCTGTCCSGVCVELAFNPNHCGTCSNACATGQMCSMGLCTCPAGLTRCEDEDTCIDTSSNIEHCGRCNHPCPDASDLRFHMTDSFCSYGKCDGKCSDGYQDADNDMRTNGCETGLYDCGNGIAEPGESCDSDDLKGYSCQTAVGFGSNGTLKCRQNCTFDTSGCSLLPPETASCGNGIAEPGEICDGKDIRLGSCEEVRGQGSAGTPGCNETCSALTFGNCSDPIEPG